MMSTSWHSIFVLSESLGQTLNKKNLTLATAESCTGGGIGFAIPQIPGSSQWYLGGINAYSNTVKRQLLGVSLSTMEYQGAVSQAVVAQMALGVNERLSTQVSIATSGIAGPDGGSEEKPVGTVCFGWQILEGSHAETQVFAGDREAVRIQSIEFSLRRLIELL